MTKRDCPSESDLQDWVLGGMSDDAADLITDHLDHCELCEDNVTKIEELGLFKPIGTPVQKFCHEPQYIDLLNSLENKTFNFVVSDGPTLNESGERVNGEAFEQPDPDPESFGRYIVEDVLGEGGFGKIFLAKDSELNRKVAIKVPHRHRISNEADMQMYLEEARTLAQLDHPNVVPIHDMGRLPDGRCFLVSKYVEGQDLWEDLRSRRYTIKESLELVANIADALDYVHQRGIIHRDIKPRNILLDLKGNPYLTDFGLAIQFENAERSDFLIGTPHYMSPEQARGEGHLVDGRSDIFSLGVVLYFLLVGVRPFDGSDIPATLQNVINLDPQPLRQINHAISRELERACLKALSKRATDRYHNANLFADDLRYLLQQVENSDSPHLAKTDIVPILGADDNSIEQYISVVPKGLRSFDKRDASFFLNLLPGPRNREGFPESIRMWKEWIEASDQSETSRVGVIYGPSGCGKSSLVKAGVLPLLDESIVKVIVECSPTGTEQRLLRALREKCPFLKTNRTLNESLADIRLGRELPAGTKVLLVLDQFEQWLHGTQDPENSELALALRQCDGVHTQTLLQVRDDFWLVLSRLMSVVEIPLIQGQNMALVDLFDPLHARKVMVQFGQAFGRYPIPPMEPTAAQEFFINEVIDDLTVDDKVFPVRIALFAEMLKGRPWTIDTLQQLGGIQGVGTMFLEESFSAAHAPAHQKMHGHAAREILRALLPDQGTDIKVCQKTTQELQQLSTYKDNSVMFEQLLRLLEQDLKLISPTEAPEAGSLLEKITSGSSQKVPFASLAGTGKTRDLATTQAAQNDITDETADQGNYYQLSHDYLIPSLREWLTRRQMQTFRGRMELQFEDRVSLWSARPYKRNLPTWWEWARFSLFLPRDRWGQTEKRMMKVSTQNYSFWTITTCMITALFFWGAFQLRRNIEVSAIIKQIPKSELAQVPGIMSQLTARQEMTDVKWQYVLQESEGDSKRELAIYLALLESDSELVVPVIERSVLKTETEEFLLSGEELDVISSSLKRFPDQASAFLWSLLSNEELSDAERLRAAILLAPLDPPLRTDKESEWIPYVEMIVDQLQIEDQDDPVFVSQVIPACSGLAKILMEPMKDVLGKKVASVTNFRRTTLLAELIKGHPELLANSIVLASKWQLPRFLPKVEKHRKQIIPYLTEIANAGPETLPVYDLDDLYSRRVAMAKALLFKWGENVNLAEALKRTDSPAERSFLIQDLAEINVPPESLVALLKQEQADPGVKSGLLLALGNYFTLPTSVSKKNPVPDEGIQLAKDLFTAHPDAGVHGAALWFLKTSGIDHPDTLIPVTVRDIAPGKNWHQNLKGKTFVRLDASTAPEIHRVFEVCTTEVTVDDYLAHNPRSNHSPETAPYGNCPVNVLTWYECVKYCRWLSEQDNVPEEEQCYPSVKEIDAEIARSGLWEVDPNHVKKSGYRLPTSAEWEFACRANSKTDRYFGNSDRLLAEYAKFGIEKGWMGIDAQWENRTWPVASLKPNEFGIFDLFGNVQEWCVDSNGERSQKRMMRGGGYGSYPFRLTVSNIENSTPDEEWMIYGLRVFRTVKE